jgi:DNA-binding IscR family transcriptional regulator
MRDPIPENLHRLILTSIPSVPFLEALLVFRASSDRAVTLRELSSRLYIPEKAAFELVLQLREAGIVKPEDGSDAQRYAPEPELANMLDLLAAFYSKNLIGVTEVIHSRTGRRAQQFADAFKWRKDS